MFWSRLQEREMLQNLFQEQMKRYYTESDIDCIEIEPDLAPYTGR